MHNRPSIPHKNEMLNGTTAIMKQYCQAVKKEREASLTSDTLDKKSKISTYGYATTLWKEFK